MPTKRSKLPRGWCTLPEAEAATGMAADRIMQHINAGRLEAQKLPDGRKPWIVRLSTIHKLIRTYPFRAPLKPVRTCTVPEGRRLTLAAAEALTGIPLDRIRHACHKKWIAGCKYLPAATGQWTWIIDKESLLAWLPRTDELSLEEASKKCGLTRATMYLVVKRDGIPAYRRPSGMRIRLSDLHAWQAARKATSSQRLAPEFGNKLQAAMRRYKLTQTALAHASGVDETQLSRALRNERTWPVHHLEKVADVLQTTPQELVKRILADNTAWLHDVAATLGRKPSKPYKPRRRS